VLDAIGRCSRLRVEACGRLKTHVRPFIKWLMRNKRNCAVLRPVVLRGRCDRHGGKVHELMGMRINCPRFV
jgi:hypothetical protein